MKKFIPIAILVFIFNACSVPTSTLDKTQSFILKNDEIPLQADFIKSDKILKIQNASLPLYLHSRSIVYIQKGCKWDLRTSLLGGFAQQSLSILAAIQI